MVLAAVGWIVLPLWRKPADGEAPGSKGERGVLIAALAVLLPLAAGVLYATFSTWKWNDPKVADAMHLSAEVRERRQRLRKRLSRDRWAGRERHGLARRSAGTQR
jgi:hypothetical protein